MAVTEGGAAVVGDANGATVSEGGGELSTGGSAVGAKAVRVATTAAFTSTVGSGEDGTGALQASIASSNTQTTPMTGLS